MSEIIQDEVVDVAGDILESSTSKSILGPVLGALVVGAGLGGAAGYFFTKRSLETKYAEISAGEIAEMRDHYHDKVIAIEGAATKPDLEALVRDRGYTSEETGPPMAVTPPAAVVEAARDSAEEEPTVENVREERAKQEAQTENVFAKDEPQPVNGWDFAAEKARRSPFRPYVIHRDEREEEPNYEEMTYTYYEADDVVCNETDAVIDEADRDRILGEGNLNRFGHGSDDPNIVYIRNDQLETVIELIRSPNSYAEEVHGLKHSDPTYPRPRRRARFDDE